MYALVITSHRSGQETCHVKSMPKTNTSLFASIVSEYSKKHTWVNQLAVFSSPALKARASELHWLSLKGWLLGIVMQGKIKGKVYTCCQENSSLFVFALLKALAGNCVHSMICNIHTERQSAPNCLLSELGKGKNREGKRFAENITLQIWRGKNQDDGDSWSPDPMI